MANIKTYNSIEVASLKSLNGVDISNLSSLSGLTVASGASDAERVYAKSQVISSFYDVCSNPVNIKGLWIFDNTDIITDRGTLSNYLINSGSITGYSGLCPYIDFTSNTYFQRNDDNDFSFGNGSTDEAFSIIALINPNSMSGNILSKYKYVYSENDKEYRFFLLSGSLWITCIDPMGLGVAYLETRSDDISSDLNTWHVYISTYDGSGDYRKLNLYRDGNKMTYSINRENGGAYGDNYVAMHNTAAVLGNFTLDGSTRTGFGDYKAGVISIIKEELSAAKVKQISQVLLSYTNSLD